MSADAELDRTPVKCPNSCLQQVGAKKTADVPREFQYVTGDTGTRNYCERCGAEMIEGTGPVVVS